ncbi:hypothetical protein FACS1894120_5100 [Clostridia bacterium]|nr:hypothetical protein FACS1894120_5100 [Clostridia bacterium]
MKKSYVKFEISGSGREKLLSFLIGRGVALWDINGDEEFVTAKCSPVMYDSVRAAAQNFDYADTRMRERRGTLVRIFETAFARPGILAGLILFFALAAMFQHLILDIDIVGPYEPETRTTVKVSQDEKEHILHELSLYGVKKGKPAHFHRDKAENFILYKIPALAWINIERTGARITVRVSDIADGGDSENTGTPANITAARGGIITEIEVYRGRGLYKAGDGVPENAVIVSGVVDGFVSKDPHTNEEVQTNDVMYTRAQAKVIAVCEVSETFWRPYVSERVIHDTGVKNGKPAITRRFINTAAGSFKLSEKGGAGIPEKNISQTSENTSRPRIIGFPLPLTVTDRVYSATTVIKTVLSAEDVQRELAEISDRYKNEILINPGRGTQVMSETVKYMPDDDGITAYVTYTVREDIGQTRDILVAG